MARTAVQPHIHHWVLPEQRPVERRGKVWDLVTGQYTTAIKHVVLNSNKAQCSCGAQRTFTGGVQRIWG